MLGVYMSNNLIDKHKPKYASPKARINLLPPEEIIPGEKYAFTVNLADTYKDKDQYVMAYRWFLQKYVKPNARFTMHFELSKMGRLHMHGYIIFKDGKSIAQFYFNLNDMQQKCSMEIDTISDAKKWQEYCIKQHLVIGEFIDEYVVDEKMIKKEKPIHLRDQFVDTLEDFKDHNLSD